MFLQHQCHFISAVFFRSVSRKFILDYLLPKLILLAFILHYIFICKNFVFFSQSIMWFIKIWALNLSPASWENQAGPLLEKVGNNGVNSVLEGGITSVKKIVTLEQAYTHTYMHTDTQTHTYIHTHLHIHRFRQTYSHTPFCTQKKHFLQT